MQEKPWALPALPLQGKHKAARGRRRRFDIGHHWASLGHARALGLSTAACNRCNQNRIVRFWNAGLEPCL